MRSNAESRVLVLEDDAELAEAMALLLESEGWLAVTTPSGTDAVLLAARERFNLAIVDLQVKSLSGQAVWQVLGDLTGVPVVAMSADAGPWQQDAFRAGVAACLPKPFDVDTLVSMITSVAKSTMTHSAGPGDVEQLSEEDIDRLRAMSEEELDALPFGLIRLDREGVISGFNAYESDASGYARNDVIGRPFQEVAPCSKVKEFADGLELAVQHPGVPRVLRFRFPRRAAVALVSVRAFFDEGRGQLWLFVSQRSGGDGALPHKGSV